MSRKAFVAAICGLLLPGWLNSTTLVPLDLGGLADQAELVFTGQAIGSESLASKDGTTAFTFVTFTVNEVLKGSTPGKEITLRFEGGDLGGRVLVVEGMPRFEEGESYLLFVHGNGSFASPVVGWWQGQYQFSRDAQSGRHLLVDSQGAPLRGILGDRWQRGLPARDKATKAWQQDVEGNEGVVLEEEGVRISVPGAGADEKAAASRAVAPDAAQVMRGLRVFLRERALSKTFAPGSVVRSAHPEDIPVNAVTAPPFEP